MSNWLQVLWQDLQYGARLLRTNKVVTAAALLSLALGIGANTAIFQLIDAVRLRSLPVKDPQSLAFVQISERSWAPGNVTGYYSWLTDPMWQQIRQRQQVFSSVAAFSGNRMNLARGGEARPAMTMFVSGDFFQVMGVSALLGRVLTSSDDQPGCSTAGAVISYSLWQREYAGLHDAIGKELTVEGHPFTIIGVTPQSFDGLDVGRNYEVAVPMCAEPTVDGEYSYLNPKVTRLTWWMGVIGRLRPGVSLKQANAQMAAISPAVFQTTIPAQFDPESKSHYLEYKLSAEPAANGTSSLRRQYEDPLWLLLAIACLVLLVACANLANLMLARASARERELAVRLALGARRGRLIRQLLCESLLMASLGAAIGLWMAQLVSRGLLTFLTTQDRPVTVDLGLDWRMLGFTAALAIITGLMFGLTPALRATRTLAATALNAGARTVGVSRERFGLRRALVVTQIALSLVLVSGAFLFVGSLRNLLSVDAGFQQNGILVVDVDFTKVPVPKNQRGVYKQHLVESARALPGVEQAAVTDSVPVSGNSWTEGIVVDGKRVGNSLMNHISPGYLETMGTPLLAGRDFDAHDAASSPKVAIVNETLSRRYFGGGAVGKIFRLDVFQGAQAMLAKSANPQYLIVGIMKDAKYLDLREEFEPVAFVPMAQDEHPDQATELMVRSQMSLDALTLELKSMFNGIDPAIGITFSSFQTQIRDGLLRERLMAMLSTFFGILAALLAAIGIYGVIAYMVARRTNEIGIRMALGATPANVIAMILREAFVMLAAGAAIGAVLAAFGARAAKALLFGLTPGDPRTVLLSIAVLGALAIIASYWPARRAALLEPIKALREE